MNARVAALLVALLVLLGGGALYFQQQGQSQRPDAAAALGQPLLRDLKAADIAAIHIREPQASLTLERKDARWVVAERGGFPADLDKVREFVLLAIGLKIGQSEPIGDQDRARLQLDAAGTLVEFRDAQGKALASLIVGKKYFKREPENPERAIGDGRFVLRPGDPGRVIIVSSALTLATAKSAAWVAPAGLAVDQARALTVRLADGESWKIERAADNADWKLAGLGPHEKLELTRANAAAYSFTTLDIADVAPADATPEALGLDRPSVATVSTFDGLTYTVKVGKPAGEQYPVAVSIAGEPAPSGQDAEARGRKLAERLARERGLEGHVLLVAKGRLDDVLRRRAELLAKPQDKKK